jgi:hypothetical protein
MLVNFIERTVNYEPLLGGVGKLELNYVLSNLPKLIIKKTNRDLGLNLFTEEN